MGFSNGRVAEGLRLLCWFLVLGVVVFVGPALLVVVIVVLVVLVIIDLEQQKEY